MVGQKGKAKTAEEQNTAILTLIENGESLRKACQQIGVDPGNFIRRTAADADLEQRYARAREKGYDVKADELLEVEADIIRLVEGGMADQTAVAIMKQRADNLKWLLARRHPKAYGDRTQSDVNLVTTVADSELEAKLAALLAKLG